MLVEVTAWQKSYRNFPPRKQAATFIVCLTAAEVQTYGVAIHVVDAGSNRYRLVRGLSFLRTHGFTDLVDTVEANIRRQEKEHSPDAQK